MSADAPAPSRVKRWLREPLLHFLLIGFGLFAGYSALNPQAGDRYHSNRIVLTDDDRRQMAVVWSAQWQRSPTPGEMQGLIESRIREEIFYRRSIVPGSSRRREGKGRRGHGRLEFPSGKGGFARRHAPFREGGTVIYSIDSRQRVG